MIVTCVYALQKSWDCPIGMFGILACPLGQAALTFCRPGKRPARFFLQPCPFGNWALQVTCPARIGQSRDFFGVYSCKWCYYTRDTNKQDDLQRSCDYHYYQYSRPNRTNLFHKKIFFKHEIILRTANFILQPALCRGTDENIVQNHLTLGQTSKLIPPPWYKMGGGWMEPLPGVFDMLQYFETILSLVKSLWSS